MATITKKAKILETVQAVSVEVKEFSIRQVIIPIKGTSPLVIHAWSEKSKKMIADKQAGKAKNKKHEIRNPEQEYKDAKHIAKAGWEGVPAIAFKKAMVRGAKIIGMVMKDTQMAFFIHPDCEETQLVKLEGKSRMRTDMVTVGMGTSDIRYRPEYVKWSVNLNIEYNEGMLTLDQLHQLVKAAGYSCGVGEMRPEKGGDNYGRFKLANEK